MTKVSIEIEDIADQDQCLLAVQKLFAAFEEHYGETRAKYFLKNYYEPARQKTIANFDFAKSAIGPWEDLRLVLEYYAMPKPTKERLATHLARKNETLPQIERYGPRGPPIR